MDSKHTPGPRSRWTRLVKQYTAAHRATVADVEAVVDYLVANPNSCVWHAASVVSGNPCGCHDCKAVAS